MQKHVGQEIIPGELLERLEDFRLSWNSLHRLRPEGQRVGLFIPSKVGNGWLVPYAAFTSHGSNSN